MRKPNLRTADLGSNKHEFLVRLPKKRYEGLSQIADQNATSLNYQVNEAIRVMLIQAGFEPVALDSDSIGETNGR